MLCGIPIEVEILVALENMHPIKVSSPNKMFTFILPNDIGQLNGVFEFG